MRRLLVAPNSFKECAEATEIARLFSEYLDSNTFKVELLPISDGGDGFLNICKSKFKLSTLTYSVEAAYGEQLISVQVGYNEDTQTVYIESAEAIGLKVIPAELRNPSVLSSCGLGQLILQLVNDHNKGLLKIKKVIIGIGGTGTMDLGLGACKEFGLKLIDFYHKEIDVTPENFMKSGKLVLPDKSIPFDIELVQDVNVPLIGKNGSARIFGPQKGANEPEIQVLEIGYINIVNLLRKNKIEPDIESTGAGGGLAVGLSLLGNCNIRFAGDFILDDLGLSQFLNPAPEFIITGEGSFDLQSNLGKAPGFVLEQFPSGRKFLVCGTISGAREMLPDNTTVIDLSGFFSGKEESLLNIHEGIKKACDVINKSAI